MMFELGASVFNGSHKVFLSLIDFYKLRDKIIDINSSSKTLYYLDQTSLSQDEIIEKRERIEKSMRERATNYLTLGEVLKECTQDQNLMDLYIATTPDFFEATDRGSATYFREGDELDKYKTYVMSGGLSQLTEGIVTDIRDHVKFGHKVVEIRKLQDHYEVVTQVRVKGLGPRPESNEVSKNFITYLTNKIYLCVSKTDFNRIKFVNFDPRPLNKLIKRVSSFREFLIFKEPVNWLKDYNYVMTNLHIHWLIKMNHRTTMIYTDGKMADYLNSIDSETRAKIYLNDLSKIFNKSFTNNDVEQIVTRYWPEGFVVVKPKYYDEYENVIKKIEQSDKSFVQTIVPKNKGFSEGWMEGHLITI